MTISTEWLVAGGVCILAVLIGALAVRMSVQNYHAMKRIHAANAQVEAQETRDWKMFLHKVKGAVARGQEWGIDTTQLQRQAEILTLQRKAGKMWYYERSLFFAPFPLLAIIASVSFWIVPLNNNAALITALYIFGGLCLLSAVWCVRHGWRWRVAKRVAKELDTLFDQVSDQ